MDSYWNKIVAQSKSKLEGIPVISLDSYVQNLINGFIKKGIIHPNDGAKKEGFELGYKSNPNQYTQEDIYKAIKIARKEFDEEGYTIIDIQHSTEILEQINSISVIEVDKQFNIISYE